MRKRLLASLLLYTLLESCSFDELPGKKTLRTCQKPTATIASTAEVSNYLKYTVNVTGVAGDVESVVWTIGNSTETRKPAEALQVTFTGPGIYTLTATLKNSCNNNTTVEQTINVSALAPAATTIRSENVGQNSAVVVMNITSVGSGNITEAGIVFAEAPNSNPTRQNGSFQPGGSVINTEQKITLPNLKPGTTYFYRAYAMNSAGQTGYGNPMQFTTSQVSASADTWARTFGGSGADLGYHIIRNGAGYIILGNTASSSGDFTINRGSYDAWIAQIDFNGTLIWQKTIGGSGDDILRQGRPTLDGNFILVGNTSSNNGDVSGNKGGYDAWLVKISPSGAILWQRTFGTSGDEFGNCVETTPDGGFILAGNSHTSGRLNGTLWYVNGSGTQLSTISYTDRAFDDIVSPASGQYILAGSIRAASQDGWAARFHNSFSPPSYIWQNPGLGGNDEDGITAILNIPNDGPLVVGYSNTGTIAQGTWSTDLYVAKLNLSGAVSWPRTIGGSKTERAESAIQTPDGGYLLIGYSDSNDRDITGNKGGMDVLLIKLSSSGMVEWRNLIGGTGNDQAYGVAATNDGGFILIGTTTSTNGDVPGNRGGSDVFVVKIDSQGRVQR